MHKSQPLAIAIAALIGFTAACVSRGGAPPATAQPVHAGTSQFSECFAATTHVIDGRVLEQRGGPEQVIHIPSGWTVAGGAGNQARLALILCR